MPRCCWPIAAAHGTKGRGTTQNCSSHVFLRPCCAGLHREPPLTALFSFQINCLLEVELGITGGEEDGVDNTDVDNASLYSQARSPSAVQCLGHMDVCLVSGDLLFSLSTTHPLCSFPHLPFFPQFSPRTSGSATRSSPPSAPCSLSLPPLATFTASTRCDSQRAAGFRLFRPSMTEPYPTPTVASPSLPFSPAGQREAVA